MSSPKRKNLVIIGGSLWTDTERHAETSFCKHIDAERRRAGRDIEVLGLDEIDLGISDSELFLRLPNGCVYKKDSEDLPKWCLLYVCPPRVAYVLEQMGIACFSSYEMMRMFDDKMITHTMFADVLAQPDTLFLGNEKTVNEIVFDEDKYPFMLKGVNGQGGINVERVHDVDEIFDFVDAREHANELMMMQRAMPSADDVRVYCLGDEVVGCVARRPKEGIWKANLEFNPKREIYELSDDKEALIASAMEKLPSMRRGLYSFDFLFDEDGHFVFCEANCNVGTNGLDAVGLGNDLFLRYVEYIRKEMSRESEKRN